MEAVGQVLTGAALAGQLAQAGSVGDERGLGLAVLAEGGQSVQTDLEVHRQAATALAELILGGVVAVPDSPAPRSDGPDAAG